MTFGKFVRDRWLGFIVYVTVLIMIFIFCRAYRALNQAIIIIELLYTAAFFVPFLWDYFRKKIFYDKLIAQIDGLDKKYLICEMMQEPSFYEGQVLCGILEEGNKSMAEHVAEYRKQSNDFREYIETWVHEVKIPVASMRLMCHNYPEIGEKVIEQLKLVDDDVNNVLFYARSENAHKDYMIKEVTLQKMFGNVAIANRVALQLMDASLKTEGLNQVVLTDNKWMEFILGQLMSNSMKYRSLDRPLEISVYAKKVENAIELHFMDNGIGIAAADISRVWDKTFTGENGRNGAKSTGMGLYIVKNLCIQLGHGIRIISEKGKYTDVVITFVNNDFYKM